MAEQPSLIKSILKKGTIGVIIGAVLVGASMALGFPLIFQAMFFAYAMLGTAVFILLDAPPLGRVEGVKAVVALVIFYAVLSSVYIGGASLWPQYDPEDEKGKIEKFLKRRRAATEQGKTEELLARAKALSEKAEAIMARLKSAGVGEVPSGPGAPTAESGPKAAAGDLVALGKEQWELQECYNCHTIFGKKSKKRGPKLDNIGNLMTPEQMKEKILDPMSWMAEGFEKQYKKGKMPDKYKDLMFDDEIEALVVFLATLKDPSVNTPKPIKKN